MRKTGNAARGIPAHLVFKAHLLTFMLDCHRANSQLIFCPLKRTEKSHLTPEKLREERHTEVTQMFSSHSNITGESQLGDEYGCV